MTIQSVTYSPVLAGPLPTPPMQPQTGASLLAEPSNPTLSSCNDAMTMLYTMIAKNGSESLTSGENEVNTQKAEADQQLQAEQAALARQQKDEGSGKGLFASVTGLAKDVGSDLTTAHFARAVRDTSDDVKAAWNSPNFWHDVEDGAKIVGEIAAAVGGAAATVASFGSAAPAAVLITALVLSAAGTTESNCHLLEKCGVSAKADAWIGAGLGMAGAVVGGAGAAFAAPTAAASAAQAAQGMAAASSAASAAPATVSGIGQTAQGVAAASNAASAEAGVVAAGGHVKNAYFAADGENAAADAKEADDRLKFSQQAVDTIIDGLQDASQSNQRAIEILDGAMQTNAQTFVIAGGMRA